MRRLITVCIFLIFSSFISAYAAIEALLNTNDLNMLVRGSGKPHELVTLVVIKNCTDAEEINKENIVYIDAFMTDETGKYAKKFKVKMCIRDRFKSINELCSAIDEAIDYVFFCQNRAVDKFDYSSGMQLNKTTGENGFSTGYMANYELSKPLPDSCTIKNGRIDNPVEMYRGLNGTINNDGFLIVGARIVNSFDGGRTVLGANGVYFGIKNIDGNIYACDAVSEAEEKIGTAEDYYVYVFINGSRADGIIIYDNDMYTRELSISESEDLVMGIISSADNLEIDDVIAEFYDSGSEDRIKTAFENIEAALKNLSGIENLEGLYAEYMLSLIHI